MSEPAIDFVVFHLSEPGPFGIIIQVTDAKVLFDDIARLGDLLVAFNLCVSEFSRGRVFSHDPISDMIICQKIAIRFAAVPFVNKNIFDRLFDMLAIDGATRSVDVITDRSLRRLATRVMNNNRHLDTTVVSTAFDQACEHPHAILQKNRIVWQVDVGINAVAIDTHLGTRAILTEIMG